MRHSYLRNFPVVIIALVSAGLLFSISTTSSANGIYQRATLTPAPTQIPLPERPETLTNIQALLQEPDEACELPCFWEVRPGYTTEEKIIEFLQPVAVGNNAPELHFAFREKLSKESIFDLSFGTKDGLVSETNVIINNPSEWLPPQTLELSHLLSIMPSTPSAYLSINITTQRIFLTIAYDEGVLAQYAFAIRIGNDNVVSPKRKEPFLLCPEIKTNFHIILRLRDANAQFMLKEYGVLSDSVSNKVWPVERMTGMKIDEFVEQIIANPDECIKLPSYPKLVEMGYEF